MKRNGFLPLTFTLVMSLALFSCSKNAAELSLPIISQAAAATDEDDSPVSVYNSQQIWKTDFTTFAPCANKGAGEDVKLSGYVHFTDHFTVNGNHFTLISQGNYNEVSGVGLTTGNKYVATGGGRFIYEGTFENGQFTASGSDKVMLISSGAGSNSIAAFKGKITVNANGTVTHEMLDINISCK